MNINLKLVAGFAAFAFFFSFLSGLFGGVDFLIILLRSIIGSIFFGILGGGIGIAADKYFPGLFQVKNDNLEQEDTGADEGESDNLQDEVDITISEENPYGRGRRRAVDTYDEDETASAVASFSDDSSETEEELESETSLHEGSSNESSSDESSSDESSSDESSSDEDSAKTSFEGSNEELGDDEEDTDTLDYVDASPDAVEGEDSDASTEKETGKMKPNAVKAKKRRRSRDEDSVLNPIDSFEAVELDSLPGIDSFEGSFSDLTSTPDGESNSNDPGVENISKNTPGTSSKSISVTGSEHNPDEAAKAIRTWLKKDKEG